MQVTRFADPRSFLARAEPFLIGAEVENNLFLGIISTRSFGEDSYIATVDRGGAVVACAVRTPPYKAVISAADPPALVCLVRDLSEKYPDLAQVHGPEPAVARFADLWAARMGVPSIQTTRYRLFEIRKSPHAPASPAGTLRVATERDLTTLVGWLTAFIAEALPGDPTDPQTAATTAINARSLFVWDDKGPVSMAGWSGRTSRGVRVIFVYSPPEHRGRGYATAAVAELTRRLLDEGLVYCCLYADRSNPGSNRIYQSIGYHAVGESSDYILNSRKAVTVR
jgi:predicted GNAT family acetyltransferase